MNFQKTVWPADQFLDNFFNSSLIRNSITLQKDFKELEEEIYNSPDNSTSLHNVDLDTTKMNNYLTCGMSFEITSGSIKKLRLRFPKDFLTTKIEIVIDELILDISLKDINNNYELKKEEVDTTSKTYSDLNPVMNYIKCPSL